MVNLSNGAVVDVVQPGLVGGVWMKQGPTGPQGTSITSVVRTAGDGSPGSVDTYTVTFSDATTTTFDVYNGTDGTDGEVTNAQLDAALAAKADLVGGKVPSSQIPAVATTERSSVASEAAMLALSAQPGDLAVRTDVGTTFMLGQEPASTLANWIALDASDAVDSVNGQVGVVTLGAADVGAAPASHSHAIGDVTGLQSALDGKQATGDYVESTDVTDIVVLTQAAYDALGTPDANTLYVVSG